MQVFDELESMIRYHVGYNSDTGENEAEYNNLKEEIEQHTNGETPFDSLSPDAQKVVRDWESFVSDMNAFEAEGKVGDV